MNLEKDKRQALAMLKTGQEVSAVATNLNLPTMLVQEWYDSVEDEILEDITMDIAVHDKAVEILEHGAKIGTPKEELEKKLNKVASSLLSQMTPAAMTDDEQMTAMKKAADAIAVMQRSFFPASSNTVIQNLNASEAGTDKLAKWRSTMKD